MSTTPSTRQAEAEDSWLRTSWTRRPKGLMPVLPSPRPTTLLGHVPGGEVMHSAVAVVFVLDQHRVGLGGMVGWHRQRHWMDAFSSAEITSSSGESASRTHSRASRSRTLAVLGAKSGSRGTFRDRYVQGPRASSDKGGEQCDDGGRLVGDGAARRW